MKKVLDNFLSNEHYQELVEEIHNMPWFYSSSIDYFDEVEPEKYQFIHTFWEGGHTYSRKVVDLFSYYIQPIAWCRIKANFSLARDVLTENNLHIDGSHGDNTAIFYLNSNDGYTFFEDGDKVESVANRLVLFPRETMHSGTTSTDTHRIVINLNWYGPESF